MLVDAINHRKPGGATETTVLGPFYVPGSNQLPMWNGVAGELNGTPIAGAKLTAVPVVVEGGTVVVRES